MDMRPHGVFIFVTGMFVAAYFERVCYRVSQIKIVALEREVRAHGDRDREDVPRPRSRPETDACSRVCAGGCQCTIKRVDFEELVRFEKVAISISEGIDIVVRAETWVGGLPCRSLRAQLLPGDRDYRNMFGHGHECTGLC